MIEVLLTIILAPIALISCVLLVCFVIAIFKACGKPKIKYHELRLVEKEKPHK